MDCYPGDWHVWCLYLGLNVKFLFALPTASPHMLSKYRWHEYWSVVCYAINAADVTDVECLFCNGLMCLKKQVEGNSVSSFHSKITMDIQVNIVVLSRWLTAAVFVGNFLRGPVSQLMCALKHEGKTLSFLAIKMYLFLAVQRNNLISSFFVFVFKSCLHFSPHSFTMVRAKWEIADTALRITFAARKWWINTVWIECRNLPYWEACFWLNDKHIWPSFI